MLHTPPEHASPGQHPVVPQGWPDERQSCVGALQLPPRHDRPAQQGAVAEHVAPVVRHCCGYSQAPEEHESPAQHELAVQGCRHVSQVDVGGSQSLLAPHVPLQQSEDVRQRP